jgi:hypothetical protein
VILIRHKGVIGEIKGTGAYSIHIPATTTTHTIPDRGNELVSKLAWQRKKRFLLLELSSIDREITYNPMPSNNIHMLPTYAYITSVLKD